MTDREKMIEVIGGWSQEFRMGISSDGAFVQNLADRLIAEGFKRFYCPVCGESHDMRKHHFKPLEDILHEEGLS